MRTLAFLVGLLACLAHPCGPARAAEVDLTEPTVTLARMFLLALATLACFVVQPRVGRVLLLIIALALAALAVVVLR